MALSFYQANLTSYQGILQYHSISNDITTSIKYINTIYDMRLSVKFLLMYWITFSIFDAWLEQKQLQWAQYTRFSICQSKKFYSFFHFLIRICFSSIFYFVLFSRIFECAIIVYCQTNCLCCSLFLKCRSNTRRVLLISNKIRRRWSLHIYRYEYKNGKRMIHYEGSEFNNFFFFNDKFIKTKFHKLDWIRKKITYLF